MNSNEIRSKFIEYFENVDHKVVSSSSLIPHDQSLLFTNAGMVPLKDYFLGVRVPENPNMVSSQKCLRTIDIDIIGDTDRHLSFFEMLGNFSVGKYFKKEAIEYSYNFITEVLNIDKDRLWFTVYKEDDEALDIWKNVIGVSESRIQKGDKDNFWHMNIPGPCGPCSEIFIDRGSEFGEDGGPIGGGQDRFIEIWNLVFMESIQEKPFQVVGELPAKNIDTGMGLERISMIMQNKDTLFDTDLFKPLHDALLTHTTIKNQKYEKIIIDHVKASTFMLSDSVVPTNDGRGYILRRLIRRAIRANKQLNSDTESLVYLIDEVIKMYESSYPELNNNKETIKKLFTNEEKLFKKTLSKGLIEIISLIDSNKTITEKDAFFMFETYGFPYELTKEIAYEHKINLDDNNFKLLFDEHKLKSKGNTHESSTHKDFDVEKNLFVGYEKTNITSEIYHIHNDSNSTIIFTKENPFYYESGGQISDIGTVNVDGKSIKIDNLFHSSSGATGIVIEDAKFEIGQLLNLSVDKSFRSSVSKSHTAAHIVHSSLREVLGNHVAQAGSNVTPGKFRFDFSHTQKVNEKELDHVFKLSNDVIFNDFNVNTEIMNINKAKEEGALAFFGDKYDEDVRVVNIGDFSKELCGGTHVHNSHDVGLIVLLQESSIGSNLRRVEMLSGGLAFDYLSNAYKSFQSVSNLLKVPLEQVSSKINSQLETLESYKDKISKLQKYEHENIIKSVEEKVYRIKKLNVYIDELSIESNQELQSLSLQIVKNTNTDISILFSKINGKVLIIGAKNINLDFDISVLITELSILFGGGASKNPNLSIGGGPEQYDIEDAKKIAIDTLSKVL